MTIEQLRNIFRFQTEQRKMMDEWVQKRSYWVKLLRIDPVIAHNFFRREIDEYVQDITSFARIHTVVLCSLILSAILSLIVLIYPLGFLKNNVLILVGLVLQALGGGYILYGFVFPIKGLTSRNEANPIGRGGTSRMVHIDPGRIERAFKDIIEILNDNTIAMQTFQKEFAKDQIIRSGLELRKWIAQAVGFFIMVLGILLQIVGVVI